MSPLPAAPRLHNTKPFKDILERLLERTIEFSYGHPIPPRTPHTTGVYVNTDGLMLTLIEADLPATGHLGAALGVVPAERVHDELATGTLGEDLHENTAEVLNVLAAALTAELGIPHRLAKAHRPRARLNQRIRVLSGSPHRLDFNIVVHGYGHGRLSIATLLDP